MSNSEAEPADQQVLGLLADPGTPATLAATMAHDLLDAEESRRWDVRTHVQTLPPVTDGYGDLVAASQRALREQGWDGVICFTDSPLRDGPNALIADLLRRSRVAILSLPAFGALPLSRHVGTVAAELAQELTEPPREQQDEVAEQREEGPATRSRRFSRVQSPDPEVTIRIMASRAPVRLLVGLVRANQPWRLLGGLRGALAAALATSVYVLINPSVWEFGTTSVRSS